MQRGPVAVAIWMACAWALHERLAYERGKAVSRIPSGALDVPGGGHQYSGGPVQAEKQGVP